MALTSPPKLSEDDMAEVKRDVLESLRHYLCEKIIAERHFDYLRSQKILNRDDTEEILCQTNSRKKAGELLDRVAKNPKGLDAFVESIRLLKTQDFLIDKITDEVQRARNRKLASIRGDSLEDINILRTPNGSVQEANYTYSMDDKLFAPEKESTALYHPESEASLPLYFNTSLTLINQSDSEPGVTRQSVPLSSRLPVPGEPGAPPLPRSPQEACSNSAFDNQFLPLRSSSFSAP
ncbi:B-cell lymphoma/leukemia 10 [Spea bombifrons]|uniref:B-cell lymphoma/leukemia 10 n=1 Tax=Spea bombifrons TaxID=233779 RepID=UPI00234BD369|nr:B-cell lymphoma/leukemia 10 [Spea bombifrons]